MYRYKFLRAGRIRGDTSPRFDWRRYGKRLGVALGAALVTAVALAQVNFNQLPGATLPLTGNEVLPANQGATTVQFTTLNLESYVSTAIRGSANSWSALQTFPATDIALTSPSTASGTSFVCWSSGTNQFTVEGFAQCGSGVSNLNIASSSVTTFLPATVLNSVTSPVPLTYNVDFEIQPSTGSLNMGGNISQTGSGTNFFNGVTTFVTPGSAATTVTIDGFAGSATALSVLPGNNASAQGMLVQGSFVGAGPTALVAITDTGNTNGVNLRLVGNGATTPSKTIHVASGAFRIANDAYSADIFVLTDAGALSNLLSVTAGTINASTTLEQGGTPVQQLPTLLDTVSATTYTLVASDCGRTKYFTSASATTITVPSSTLAVGCITVLVMDGAASTLTGSGLTLQLAGTTTTGNRAVANGGNATLTFVTTTKAFAGGAGVT